MEVLTTCLSILLLVIMVWFVVVQIINIRKRKRRVGFNNTLKPQKTWFLGRFRGKSLIF